MRNIIDRMDSEDQFSVSQVVRVQHGVDAIDELSRNRNPMETDAAHFKKVSLHAKNLKLKAEKAKRDIQDSMRQSVIKLEEETTAKTNLIEGKYSNEIRAAYRSMENSERAKAINQAIVEKDAPTVAAIVKAPAVLTGFTNDELTRYQTEYKNLVAPDYMGKLEGILDNEQLASTALNSAISASNEYIDNERYNEVERLEGLSLAAEGAFRESFNDE